MKLMVADVDEASGIGKLPPLQRGRHALIRDAGEHDERDESGHGEREMTCALREHEGQDGSVSASPYFSIRE
jgi:hypothetical protein